MLLCRHDKDGSQHYLSHRWDSEDHSPMLDHNAERQLGVYNFGLGQVRGVVKPLLNSQTLVFTRPGNRAAFVHLQINIESMWGLLGMLDMKQLLQEAADDSESTSTNTDPSPGSPPYLPPTQQVRTLLILPA